jgi:hypothetical protein
VEAGNEAEGVFRDKGRVIHIQDAGAAFIVGNFNPFIALDQETVSDFRTVADDGGFIIIKEIIRPGFPHDGARIEGLKDQGDPGNAVLPDADPDGDGIPGVRLHGSTEKGRLITENCGEEKGIQGHRTSLPEQDWQKAKDYFIMDKGIQAR